MLNRKITLKDLLVNQRTMALLGLAILIMISIPLVKNINQKQKINRDISDMNTEIKKFESKNTELRKMVDYLSSDQFLEEQARLNFNLKKPGEDVAVIKNLDSGNTVLKDKIYDISLTQKINTKKTNPENWVYYFFKK